MVHKVSAIMIIALALVGILLLAVLAAIPSNNYAFASSQSESIPPPVYPHRSNSTGNVQESNSTGNGLFS
jgi:hypothetical protein